MMPMMMTGDGAPASKQKAVAAYVDSMIRFDVLEAKKKEIGTRAQLPGVLAGVVAAVVVVLI